MSSYNREDLSSALLPLPEVDMDGGAGAARKRQSQDDIENGKAVSNKRPDRSAEISFRLLVPQSKIGKLIGKQGSQIKLLRVETGARIKIADSQSQVEDRLVLISSKDMPAEGTSAAEDALIRVAITLVEKGPDVEREAATPGPQHHVAPNLTRLLIAGSQAGSLIGKHGAKIKELREASGASVKVIEPDQQPFPSTAMENDRLVEISGELHQVQKALELVAAKLRDNPRKEIVSLLANSYPLAAQALLSQSMLSALNAGSAANRGQGGNVRGDPFNQFLAGNGAPPSGPFGSQDGTFPKVTTEIRVQSGQMGLIIGKGGSNINQIRSISGASVKVSGLDGSSERTIIVQGTAEQVTTAQGLVNAFLSSQVMDLLPQKMLVDHTSAQAYNYPNSRLQIGY